MNHSDEIKGQRILLAGYGREGRSTHQYLLKHYPRTKISLADQKEVKPIAPVDRVFSGANYLSYLKDFDTAIRSPGIPAKTRELEAYRNSGGHITTATNIFFSICPGKTIGVTGTKGKSTTSALISQVLSSHYPDVRFAGNIGTPALDIVDGASERSIFVIELSSHQLEDVLFSPEVAVILNIVPEHLDYYKNFSAYQRAKARVLAYQKSSDFVVFNPDHPASAAVAQKGKGKPCWFTLEPRAGSLAWLDKNEVFAVDRGEVARVINLKEVPLLGNLENVLAAVAVGTLFKVPAEKMRQAIKAFQPLPHRLEFVGEFKGIKFYNDSLSTVPEATIHALEALGPSVETLIAGGFDRGLDFAELGKYLAKHEGLKTLILFPDTGRKIWEAVVKANQVIKRMTRIRDARGGVPFRSSVTALTKKTIVTGVGLDLDGARRRYADLSAAGPADLQKFDVSSMEEAVKLAYKHTSAGKICLLSPAAASFNLFKNYAERGEKFKELVKIYGS